jgi:ferredoxin-thioredoxin reductase catalytic subunit
MGYTESLPNQRLKNDEDRVRNHLALVTALYSKKVSALQKIIEGTKNDLQKVSILDVPKKDTTSQKNLLNDIVDCCKFSSGDLQTYFSCMCEVTSEMEEHIKDIEDCPLLVGGVYEFIKTTNALLTIISNSRNLLDDEVKQSERFLQEGANITT